MVVTSTGSSKISKINRGGKLEMLWIDKIKKILMTQMILKTSMINRREKPKREGTGNELRWKQ